MGVMQETEKNMRGYGMRLLAKREYSPQELRTKMGDKYEDPNLAASIVAQWEQLGHVSNERFTEDFVQHQVLTTKNGPRMILERLKAKGGDAGYGRQVIEKYFGRKDRQAVIHKLIIKKKEQLAGRGYSDFDINGKIMAFVVGKGFDVEEVKAFL